MKYPISCELERIASEEPSSYGINFVSLKGRELYATNGKAAVIVPVDRGKDDVNALIPPEVFPQARKHALRREEGLIIDGPEIKVRKETIRVIGEKGMCIAEPDREGLKFPNVKDVVPKDKDVELIGYFDGDLMIRTLQAMGAHKSPRPVALYASKGEDRPFRLEIELKYQGIDG